VEVVLVAHLVVAAVQGDGQLAILLLVQVQHTPLRWVLVVPVAQVPGKVQMERRHLLAQYLVHWVVVVVDRILQVLLD
jgi:hypothetical protein